MSTTSDMRRSFLDFFVKKKGHEEFPSSSLMPKNDPTLMFTNSGMVQFKDIFTGKKVTSLKRATTAQTCLRAGGKHNDLENVGYTSRHHTFFEMLGNFSFGDYFKEEAITWAWEYITKILSLPQKKLLVTVHSSDEMAASLWKKIAGFSDDKIIRIPTNDNFWMMGDTGPCGPCSEIFYDHGEKIQGGAPGSQNEDGDRFIEIWNLVFTQFNTLEDGTRVSLEQPCIDTGMGLERIAAVMQGVSSNYHIDLFKEIISDIKHITSIDNPKFEHHYNVIADHIRAVCFMIAHGIMPSNDGRGYVLRRIIRRAIRHGYTMGLRDSFLHKLVESVKKTMGGHYKELIHFENNIVETIKTEELSFMKTINKGMFILTSELEKIGSTSVFPADVAYKLYDTFGFPLDLTQDILKSDKKTINEIDFIKISNENKEKAKKAWVGTGDSSVDKVWYDLKSNIGDIGFLRKTSQFTCDIEAIIQNGEIVDSVKESKEPVYIVCKTTPFYAEAGGQSGDVGLIIQGKPNQTDINPNYANYADVIDTKIIAGVHAHECIVKRGTISSYKKATLRVAPEKRLACSRNHTATHLMQSALKEVLGTRIYQNVSQVTPDRLRFDFTYTGEIDKLQIARIERIVNNRIEGIVYNKKYEGLPVKTEVMPIEEAMKSGAIASFGEKYPKVVRVVTIGEDDWSKELCCGEHVSNTLEIKNMKILSVSSIGFGIKRIEAITGDCVRKYLEKENYKLSEKIIDLQIDNKMLKKQIIELISNKNINFKEEILKNGIKFMISHVEDMEHEAILNRIDKEKSCDGKKIVLITNTHTQKNKFSVCLFANNNIDAIDILKKTDENIKVGGRKDLAQAGGLLLEKLVDFEKAVKFAVIALDL